MSANTSLVSVWLLPVASTRVTRAICDNHVPDLYRVPDNHLACWMQATSTCFSAWAFLQSHDLTLHDPVRRRTDDGHPVRALVPGRIALALDNHHRLPSWSRIRVECDPCLFHLAKPNMAPGCHVHVRQAALPMIAVRRDSMCWFRLLKDRPYSGSLASDADRHLRIMKMLVRSRKPRVDTYS